jgi:hypothetical protein
VVAARITKGKEESTEGLHLWCEQDTLQRFHLEPNAHLTGIRGRLIPRQMVLPYRMDPTAAIILYEDHSTAQRTIKYVRAFGGDRTTGEPGTLLAGPTEGYIEAQIAPDGQTIAYVRTNDTSVCVAPLSWNHGNPQAQFTDARCPLKGYQPRWDSGSQAFYVFTDQGTIVRVDLPPKGQPARSNPLGPRAFDFYTHLLGNNFAAVTTADRNTIEFLLNEKIRTDDEINILPNWHSAARR